MSKERKQFENTFMPLFKFCHRKDDALKQKQALFYNQNKINIFKGESLSKYFAEHFEEINKLYPQVHGQSFVIGEDGAGVQNMIKK